MGQKFDFSLSEHLISELAGIPQSLLHKDIEVIFR
jgi:hypothetical protein